ncbi:SusC/RagA family TonB-linked outer membrane protein [Olivibacter jilunii]|uniref:SusC/RagA family TonB-linked outer membrane protein n=1 Tax=Olivibacter jilunii TaxID=985016 RepID=UPI003F17136F
MKLILQQVVIRIVMRIATIIAFLIISLSCSFATTGKAQGLATLTVHLDMKQATVKQVLEVLESKINYKFLYPKALDSYKSPVSISGTYAVSDILVELATQTGLSFRQINHTIAVSLNNVKAKSDAIKQLLVSGRVTDSLGNPLPGASVLVKGGGKGANTDSQGHYRIQAAKGDVLLFSYVGYRQLEVPVEGKQTIDVQLHEEGAALSEVVVVGYGVQKKATVTGAVATVSGKEINKAPTTHVANTLAGRVAGITGLEKTGEPGSGGAQLFIRGQSTLGDNSPLLVVDGVPSLLGGLDKLDPNDIETVSVLKDASASIYGARAANGVILVKTKRGIDGKPTLDYSFNQGFVTPTRMPKMADAPLYAQLTNEILEYAGQPIKFSAEDIQKFADGSSPYTHPNTDWIDAVIKPLSLQNRHNLGLRGGSENIKYFVSLGSQYEDAVYRNSATNYKQQNLRVNLDAKVNEYIQLSFDLQGRHTNRNYAPRGAGDIFRFIQRGRPTETAIWPNGLPGPDIEGGNNPVVTATEEAGYNHHVINLGNAIIGYKIKIPGVEGLFVDGTYAASVEVLHRKNFVKPWTLYSFGGFDENNEPKLVAAQRGVNSPELTERYDQNQQVLFNTKINYVRSFGKHSLNSFVAYEQNVDKGTNILGYRRDFISPVVDQLFAGGQDMRRVEGYGYEFARRNYFGRVSYQYNDTYLLDLNFRVDGSQNFPAGKRYGFFPGVSAGWVLSNESFWTKYAKTVNFMKLRASYGQMGNDKIDNFQFLSNYGFEKNSVLQGAIFGDNLTFNPAIYPVRVANPNITWEVANTLNVGLEAQLWNGRFGLEFDYFRADRDKILIQRAQSIPQYAGFSLPDENLGKVRNQGFDAVLSHRNTFGNLRMDISGTVSFARNKILFWDESQNIPAYQQYTGSRIGSGLYYHAIGVFKNEEELENYPHWSGARPGDVIFEDFNRDGKIDALDRIRFEPSFPEWNFGLNINLQYKNFDLSALFQGATGGSQYVRTESGLIGNFPLAFVENRWTPDNPNTNVPRVYDTREYWITQGNSHWLWDTDYVRLKTLQVGYSLPAHVIEKIKLKGLRFYLSGQNLFTWDKMKIFDPEIHDREDNGNQAHYYPQIKIYNIGANLTF